MTNADEWYSINIKVQPEMTEAIEFAMNSLDAIGMSINHLRKVNANSVTVVGYFNELPDEMIMQDEVHYALRAYGFDEESVISIEREKIANADWLAEWKKHWKPTTIRRLVIAPPWETVDDPDKIVIRIEPGMAFGTGTHGSTRLCLAQIEKLYEPGDSFLDVGTGTGVLAIAVAKLAAEQDIKKEPSSVPSSKILACDTDTDSIRIARENADVNGVGNLIEFYEGSISDDTPAFDFICANITIDVIMPRLDMLLERSRKVLLMSGIVVEQQPAIVDALKERGLNDHSIDRLGDWISVTVPIG